MNTNNSLKKIFSHITTDKLFLFLSLIIYNFLVILWHSYNHAIPTSDAISYLTDAYRRYNDFFDYGFIKGTLNLYLEHGWRPQIFPIFCVPFLLLFGNNPLYAVTGVSILFASIFISYIYLFLRTSLTPFYSFLTALLIATYSVSFQYNLIFFSEIAYIPFILASFYHLFKSEYFSNNFHSLLSGIFVGLVFCIRPAESIIFFIIGLMPFVALGIKNRNITITHLLICLNIILATIVLLFYFTYILPNGETKYILAIPIIFAAIKALKNVYYNHEKNSSFMIFILSLCTLIFFYWLPSVDKLINWSFEASFGTVVQSLAVQRATFLGQFFYLISTWNYLLLPLILLLLLPLVNLNYKSFLQKDKIILAIISILPLILLMYSYTLSYNDNQIIRRSLVMCMLLWIFLAKVCLDKNLKFKSLSLLIILPFLTLNIIGILASTFYNKPNNRIVNFVMKYENILNDSKFIQNHHDYKLKLEHSLPMADLRPIDRHILLADKIARNICKYDNKNCLAQYISFFIPEPISYQNDFIDPFATGFASAVYRKHEKEFGVGLVFMAKDENPYEVMKQKNVNFLVIPEQKTITDEMLMNNKSFAAQILREYRQNNLQRLKLIDSFYIYNNKILILQNLDVALSS